MKKISIALILLLTNTIGWAHEKNHENYYNVDHLSFISSQVPRAKDGKVAVSIEEQIQQTFKNLVKTAQVAGATIENGKIKNMVKLNIYLTDPAALTVVDQYMLDYVTGNLPARTPLGGINFGNAGFLVAMDAVVELPR